MKTLIFLPSSFSSLFLFLSLSPEEDNSDCKVMPDKSDNCLLLELVCTFSDLFSSDEEFSNKTFEERFSNSLSFEEGVSNTFSFFELDWTSGMFCEVIRLARISPADSSVLGSVAGDSKDDLCNELCPAEILMLSFKVDISLQKIIKQRLSDHYRIRHLIVIFLFFF